MTNGENAKRRKGNGARGIPAKSTIVHWWYDYAIDAYRQGGWDRKPAFADRLLIDVGEPVCWGCQRYKEEWDYAMWYRAKDNPRLADLCQNWNRLPLERCHIIAKSRNGGNEPSNFVLLCPECHEASPDILDRDAFLRWLDLRPAQFIEIWKAQTLPVCQAFGVGLDDYSDMLMVIELNDDHDELIEFAVDYSTAHFGKNGTVNKRSSHAAALIQFFRQKYSLSPADELATAFDRCIESLG